MISNSKKILLLNFDEDKLKLIKAVFSNTSFKDSKFYESSNIEDARVTSYWNELELILYQGNPNNDIQSDSFKYTANKIPILFITEKIIDFELKPNLPSNIPNYLPLNEVTSFVLEMCLNNAIEKNLIGTKLYKLEQIKKKLIFKEKKFRDLFDNSSFGMYEVDPNGNFILANQVFLKILGLKKYSELRELNAFKIGISTNGTRQKLKQLLVENEKIYNFEDEWLKADKSKIFVKENIRAKKGPNGFVKYYQGVIEDITESKKIETELVISKKEAEKSDRLKSEFLAHISHEIRTPVNTLLSFASLIKEDLSNSLSLELLDSFKHMDKAGQRIIRTIDLLVKMSELHTDNYEPEFKQNDLFELLEELVSEYKPIAEEKNLDLQFIKGVDTANIVFDKLTMYDVFSNIIDNAIKFTEEGTVEIYIKNTLMNKLSVTVIDTGIGISKKYIGSIFQSFSQETSGYTRKFDGNGLGLALVKKYCDLNNAEIFVSSEKNTGSNFTIIFK